MEELMEVNPGFKSRIQFKLKFPDYTAEELYEIFKKVVKEQKYKLSHNAKISLMQYFEKERQKENFSNGRCVRNLFEKIKFEQAERVVTEILKAKEANHTSLQLQYADDWMSDRLSKYLAKDWVVMDDAAGRAAR